MKSIKLLHYLKMYLTWLCYKLIYGKKLQIGKNVVWRKSLSIMIDTGASVIIGNDCFFNNYCSLNANERIEIGQGTIFGENVKIYDHNHRFADRQQLLKKQGFSTEPVHIGKNCWIGSNVVILKGTIIGDNCIVGAGTVLSGNIGDGKIVTQRRELEYRDIIFK
ncbi:acyltransferase [Streptococcus suis]|uniref:acyltransferase n=2 Tax=Streptococcus TaxID=1301 RepID=UPI001FBA2B78|nr:acyltransferase [Streptococcus suis]